MNEQEPTPEPFSWLELLEWLCICIAFSVSVIVIAGFAGWLYAVAGYAGCYEQKQKATQDLPTARSGRQHHGLGPAPRGQTSPG